MRWWLRGIILIAVMVWFVFGVKAAAQANTKVRWDSPSVGCYRYRVQEFRDGSAFHSRIWTIKQRVQWCMNSPYFTIMFSGPTRHLNHEESASWIWGGWQTKRVTKLLHPTRWKFYVKAEVDGITGWPFVVHNYPWIRMTIWKKNPTHVSYDASCGCNLL